MSSKLGINSELQDLTHLDEVEASILFRIDGNVVDSSFKEEYSHKLLRTIQWCKANVDKVSDLNDYRTSFFSFSFTYFKWCQKKICSNIHN